MSVLNWQVNSSSNYVSFSIVMTQIYPVNFKLISFLVPIKVPIFRLSNMLYWKFAKFLKSLLKAQVIFPSNVASIFSTTKHNYPMLFLAQTLYTLFKRNRLKCKFFRFSNTRVKIRQIPHVKFELTSQFLSKFCIIVISNFVIVFWKYSLSILATPRSSVYYFIVTSSTIFFFSFIFFFFIKKCNPRWLRFLVKVLDFQSRGPILKTTGWLQGWLSLSSLRGR